MTPAEWENSIDPLWMLQFLRDSGHLTERKARLFAVACCRRIWHSLSHPDSFRGIEVAEEFADGKGTAEELRAAEELAVWAGDDLSWHSMHDATAAWAAAAPLFRDGMETARHVLYEVQKLYPGSEARGQEEAVAQAGLLRDLFRPLQPLPTWNHGGLIRRLAQAAYDDRFLPSGQLDPARLAVLADALEEAGCGDAGLLEHLRSPGPHVRGCFALDVVLGKS